MRNQPEYSFFKNWGYALSGFLEVLKNEKALKLELSVFTILTTLSMFFSFDISHRILMISCFFIVIIIELINSAIERCVDLVTLEFHELAKRAKDAASGAVMFANFLTTFIWAVFVYIDLIK